MPMTKKEFFDKLTEMGIEDNHLIVFRNTEDDSEIDDVDTLEDAVSRDGSNFWEIFV